MQAGHLKQLNSPWGMAPAPRAFSAFSGDIFVGNFGSGRIAAFTKNGKFVSYLLTRARTPFISLVYGNISGQHGTAIPKNFTVQQDLMMNPMGFWGTSR